MPNSRKARKAIRRTHRRWAGTSARRLAAWYAHARRERRRQSSDLGIMWQLLRFLMNRASPAEAELVMNGLRLTWAYHTLVHRRTGPQTAAASAAGAGRRRQ